MCRGGVAHYTGWRRRTACADVGLWRRVDGPDRIHGDGILQAADDDLSRRVSADARGGIAGECVALFPARGALSRGNRADLRTLCLRSLASAGPTRGERSESR